MDNKPKGHGCLGGQTNNPVCMGFCSSGSFLLQKRLGRLAWSLHVSAVSSVYKLVLHKPLFAVQASEWRIIQACFIEGTWFPWQFIKDGGLVSS